MLGRFLADYQSLIADAASEPGTVGHVLVGLGLLAGELKLAAGAMLLAVAGLLCVVVLLGQNRTQRFYQGLWRLVQTILLASVPVLWLPLVFPALMAAAAAMMGWLFPGAVWFDALTLGSATFVGLVLYLPVLELGMLILTWRQARADRQAERYRVTCWQGRVSGH